MSELLLPERQALICQRLKSQGRVVSAELAAELSVSEDTIRRDLKELAAAGLCEKVYGGALPPAFHPGSLTERSRVAPENKASLARSAISRIEPATVVFLDAGSTNLALAEALPQDFALTAVTNAPAIASILLEKPAVETILLGGIVDRAMGGAISAKARDDLAVIKPDLCILGACGIGTEGDVRAFGYEDAGFKRFAASISKKTMVVVTAAKFEIVAPYAVLPASAYACLVTEQAADRNRLRLIAAEGCDIVLTRD
ncbi:DeoR/GlpR family DNA-binding transcription regulator [Oryzifoliimicrobium ureilyticus]|uniref:DeoR/GlpR family DNA-binding transcription regulator n=1 Tax=Oryzifoliimicrobium ureilyticus TaxID=3113724 RepID=UPI00307672A8